MIKIKWLARFMGVKWLRESGYVFLLLVFLHRVTYWSSQVIPASGCPNFRFQDYDGEDSTSSKFIHSVL